MYTKLNPELSSCVLKKAADTLENKNVSGRTRIAYLMEEKSIKSESAAVASF